MKKLILVVGIALGMTFVSCNNKSTDTKPDEVEENLVLENDGIVDTEHTSQNSLDWFGTYEGLLPCADCEAIKTTITLTEEGTFVYTAEYLNKDLIVENSGKIVWDETGNTIILEDEESFNVQLVVAENALIQLDTEGNLIEGALAEHYRLNKIN